MSRRVSRRYSWSEIQTLARDLRALLLDADLESHPVQPQSSSETAPESPPPPHERSGVSVESATPRERSSDASRHSSRVARVERLRADLGENLLQVERVHESQDSAPRPVFDPVSFKEAWRAQRIAQERSAHRSPLDAPSSHEERSAQALIQTQPSALTQTQPPVSTPLRRSSERSDTSPWDLLRDHFLELRRRRMEREALARGEDESQGHEVDVDSPKH